MRVLIQALLPESPGESHCQSVQWTQTSEWVVNRTVHMGWR